MKPLWKYLCLVLLILSICVKSQENLDSLWGVWNNSSQLDSSRFSALSKIIKAEPDSAFVYCQLMHDLAKKKNNKKWLSKALIEQGLFDYGHGDYDSSQITALGTLESSKLCEDNTRLKWNEIMNYEDVNSWGQAGDGEIIDGMLLMIFTFISIFGLTKKKR